MTNPTDIAARTAWAEARGTGATGMQRVLNVIVNRSLHPRWWGHDVASVCLDPWQFSCWNADDPNRPKLLAVTEADPWFAIAMGLAQRAVAGVLPDLTGGADSYYALSMKTPPAWAARAVHTVSDGWHWFGRVELGPDARNVGVSSTPVDQEKPAEIHAIPHVDMPKPVPSSTSTNADDSADALNAAELAKDQA